MKWEKFNWWEYFCEQKYEWKCVGKYFTIENECVINDLTNR